MLHGFICTKYYRANTFIDFADLSKLRMKVFLQFLSLIIDNWLYKAAHHCVTAKSSRNIIGWLTATVLLLEYFVLCGKCTYGYTFKAWYSHEVHK